MSLCHFCVHDAITHGGSTKEEQLSASRLQILHLLIWQILWAACYTNLAAAFNELVARLVSVNVWPWASSSNWFAFLTRPAMTPGCAVCSHDQQESFFKIQGGKKNVSNCLMFDVCQSDFLSSVIAFCSSSVPGYWLCSSRARRGRQGSTRGEEEKDSRDSAQWAGTLLPPLVRTQTGSKWKKWRRKRRKLRQMEEVDGK